MFLFSSVDRIVSAVGSLATVATASSSPLPILSRVRPEELHSAPMGNKVSIEDNRPANPAPGPLTRIPSSVRYKQRDSVATLPKPVKPEHHEIEQRFNKVLVSISPSVDSSSRSRGPSRPSSDESERRWLVAVISRPFLKLTRCNLPLQIAEQPIRMNHICYLMSVVRFIKRSQTGQMDRPDRE